MATYQTDYSDAPAIGLPGLVANEELCNIISREVESAAGIAFGQPAFRGSDDHGVVAGGTFAATGAGSASAGNVGTGAITASPAITAGAKQGRYRIVLTGTSATAPYLVYDPDGILVGHGVVATANTTIPGITTFTIANAGTMTAGDTYFIDVTFTANAKFVGIAKMTPAVPANATTPDAYPQRFTGAFVTQGPIFVVAGASVADGDDAYWNPATGRYTNNSSHVRIPKTVFDTTAADGDLVELSIKNR